MYKVVLIDDETIIVEGLKKIVAWQKYDCQVVAVAHDGQSGAAAIRKHSPDIIFTDIRMPNQDGLSMLAGLKSEFPNMQIIVLTGFRDFSYAQEAIRLGVSRFLLKPSKMNEIDEALLSITQRLASMVEPKKEALKEDAPIEVQSEASSFIARQAVAYIEENYANKLSLGEVADQCYVSQWHLSKLLNKHLNQSFYDILNRVRIDKAKKLLADPSLKISDICEMVGYADTAHFSRVFKKVAQISANEYRNTFSIPL